MIFNNLKNSFVSAAALLVGMAVPVLAAPVKNIVVVHGAFADGSGWKPVYDILVKDGYSVTVVQEPLTSLEEDKTINPDLERMYAERAHSHKVEAEGASHALYISHAKEVAALIEEAADQSRVAHSD